MRNRVVILLVIIGAALVSGGVWYYIQSKMPKHDWREKYYTAKSKKPYGLSIIHDLLAQQKEDQFREQNIGFDYLMTDLYDHGYDSNVYNYVFIGEMPYYKHYDIEALLSFAEDGNTVLISSYRLTDEFFRILLDIEEYETDTEIVTDSSNAYLYSQVQVIEEKPINADSSSIYELYKQFRIPFTGYPRAFDLITNDTSYIRSFSFYKNEVRDTVDFENQVFYYSQTLDKYLDYQVLLKSAASNRNMMISIPYGDGKILLHNLPVAFTNFHLLKEDGKKHAEFILSQLNPGIVIWDNFSRIFSNSPDDPDIRYSGETPLSYILSIPALAWAFYVLLGSCLIYVVFNAKRKQRPVPLIAPKTNTSLEFVRMVGQLYYKDKDHRALIERIMQQFYTDAYARYHIQDRNPDSFAKKLSVRSGVDIRLITDIIKKYNKLHTQHYEPDDHHVGMFYEAIQEFHQKKQ